MEKTENNFGGFWTENKINIFIKYIKAYLDIMNKQNFELVYFDGFAGSGFIKTKQNNLIDGVALKVLSIEKKKGFDIYYFVELNKQKSDELNNTLTKNFVEKKKRIYVVNSDCNEKLVSLSNYLSKNKNRRAIVFLDPKGMQLKFRLLDNFKDLGIDMWLLIPTGIGVNRLLNKDGKNISDEFVSKLSEFLGITKSEVTSYFYKEKVNKTLFGDESELIKEDAINKSLQLVKIKLKNIFKFVSTPFPMKNSKNSLMYHFIFATNSPAGLKIANEIIGKELKESKS